MTERITQRNVLQLWAAQYPEVERWLSHLQQKNMNAFSLYRFCLWCKLTPTQLLDEKKKNPSANTVEKILDDFCNMDDTRFTNSFQYQASIAVKSFFRWNYTDLAKASGAVTLEKKKPYNALNKEGLRKLWSHARSLRDRALIPFVLSTAVAKETLSKLQWKDLEENWENIELPCLNVPPEKLKGHGRGRYANVRQTTFLTPEAKRALIDYKEWQEKKLGRAVRLEDNIWLDNIAPYKPLEYDSFSTLILRLSRDAGVGFTWHDARRWVNTALESIAISSNWARKIRGRKVKGEEAPYSQPAIEQLRAKYREAVHALEFTSETQTVSKEVEQRLKALEEFKASQTPEQLEKARLAGIQFRKKEAIDEAAKKCADGEHCEEDFKQIPESELLGYLKQGWAIVKELSNGEVIIKNR